jgi:hypothetical protein
MHQLRKGEKMSLFCVFSVPFWHFGFVKKRQSDLLLPTHQVDSSYIEKKIEA